MSTKRTRSHSPRRIQGTAQPNPAKPTSPDMPKFDATKPHRWLLDMEKWFLARNITDDHAKFLIIAANQSPSDYAILKAEAQQAPEIDSYEIARKFVLRQLISDPPSTARNIEAAARINASITGATAVASPQPPVTHDNRISYEQSLQQLETRLLAEIRSIKIDVAELQALMPTQRRRPRSSVRIRSEAHVTAQPIPLARNQPATAPEQHDECWYHQTHGHQAQLCRAPCRHRPQ